MVQEVFVAGDGDLNVDHRMDGGDELTGHSKEQEKPEEQGPEEQKPEELEP